MLRQAFLFVLCCSVTVGAEPKVVKPRNEAQLIALVKKSGGSVYMRDGVLYTVSMRKGLDGPVIGTPAEVLEALKLSRGIRQALHFTVKSEDYKYFAELPYLEDLACVGDSDHPITNDALKAIQNLKLRRLQLGWSQVDDDGLKYLANMKTLEELDLHGNDRVTDQGLAVLTGLTSLKRIYLGVCPQITGTGFPLTWPLERIAIAEGISLEGIRRIGEFKIQTLRLIGKSDARVNMTTFNFLAPEVQAEVVRLSRLNHFKVEQ